MINQTLLVVILCILFAGAALAAETRPNIILLMGDDHGWEETGYHGHPHVKTPVLDEMAVGGKATRDFTNFRHPALTDADYLGPRAIIDGRFKLVIHEQPNGNVRRELFDLEVDPAEKTNLSTNNQPLPRSSKPSSATGSSRC